MLASRDPARPDDRVDESPAVLRGHAQHGACDHLEPRLRRPTARVAGAMPPGLPALLPRLALDPRGQGGPAADLLLVQGRHAAREARVETAGRGAAVLTISHGPLQAPPFRRLTPWLSVSAGEVCFAGRRSSSGALDVFMPRNEQTDVASAMERIRRDRSAGAFWAAAPGSDALRASGPGLSIVAACAFHDSASRIMLISALARADASRTLLLASPRARLASTRGAATAAGCRILNHPVDPWALLDAAAELHVADGCDCYGAVAFVAELVGVPARAHAAGAGRPHAPAPPPDAAETLAWTACADPFTGRACTLERALDLAGDWRRVCDANRKVAACIGMQAWKRRRVARFLHDGVRPPAFRRGAASAVAVACEAGGGVAVWASRVPDGLEARAAARGVPLLRVEDGFLRSVGLGSDFTMPCSIVLDASGLYYDPSGPSDLETLLQTVAFPPELKVRAARLVERLVRGGLTKYNTGTSGLPELKPGGRRVILVPGQVADDLSVRLGGGAARGNADLLRRVRASRPDALVLYKPHPDVDAGHRPGAVPDDEALRSADQVVRGVPMGALIAAVDEVHTMTSLAGFEALLRGRDVVVWGRPFYAGWGLTRDMTALPRRTRRLDLDDLAAGVLLLYPRYLDPVTLIPCPAEVLLDRMAEPALWRPGLLVRARRLQGRAARGWRDFAQGRRGAPLQQRQERA